MRSVHYEIFKTSVRVNYHGCDSSFKFSHLEVSGGNADLWIDLYYDLSGETLNWLAKGAVAPEVRHAEGGRYFQTFRKDVCRAFVFFEDISDLDFVLEHVLDRSFRAYHPEFDIFFMHAACVEVSEGKAALFTAPSGGGKSTFCSLAEGRGFKVRGDEACAVKRVRDKYYAGFFPGFEGRRDIDESVEVVGVFCLNRCPFDSVEELSGVRALKKVLPESTWLSVKQLRRTKEEYRMYVFNAVQSMYETMPFKLLNFTLQSEKIACLT